jgi:hypothetical protein
VRPRSESRPPCGRSGRASPGLPVFGPPGAGPASAKPNTIESRCDASGQPSRVSLRLRVSASRTTVIAALPGTADRGNRRRGRWACKASNCCRKRQILRNEVSRDRNTPVSQPNSRISPTLRVSDAQYRFLGGSPRPDFSAGASRRCAGFSCSDGFFVQHTARLRLPCRQRQRPAIVGEDVFHFH